MRFESAMTAGLGECVTAVNDWYTSKYLQLNMNKTKVMWFGSATNLSKLSSVDKLIKLLHLNANLKSIYFLLPTYNKTIL